MSSDLGVLVGIVCERVELAQRVWLVAGRQTCQSSIQTRRGYVRAIRVRGQVAIEGRDGVAVVHGEVACAAQDERIDLASRAQVVQQARRIGRGTGRRKLVERGLECLDGGITFPQVAADLGQTEELLA